MAKGILVVPLERLFKLSEVAGKIVPIPIPINMARKIQSVKNLSRNLSRFFI
jgi:hypothetical protein